MCEMKGGEWGEEEERKKQRRGREEPLYNKQASLPPPACRAQLLVIDPGGAVNGSGMESVCCVCF